MVDSKDIKNKICEYLDKIDLKDLSMKNLLLYSEIAKNVHNMEQMSAFERFAANFCYKFPEPEKKGESNG